MVQCRTGASAWPRRSRESPSNGPTVPVAEQTAHVAWTGAAPELRSHELDRLAPVPAAIETTELRWFQEGPLPSSVYSWMTNDGAVGAMEERCDLYRMDGRVDVGVKLRAQSVLELKVRQSTTSTTPSNVGRLGAGGPPGGVVEVWRKWSPADQLVSVGFERWVEVRKTIVKRRFTITGTEVAVLELPAPVGPFCDVEIVAIDDGSAAAWSFAFAAQGSRRSRHASIGTAWRTLASLAAPSPPSLDFAVSCGYPEWLGRRVGDASTMTGR
jgi:hypothetical protein